MKIAVIFVIIIIIYLQILSENDGYNNVIWQMMANPVIEFIVNSSVKAKVYVWSILMGFTVLEESGLLLS